MTSPASPTSTRSTAAGSQPEERPTSMNRSSAPSRCCSPNPPLRRSVQASCRHLLVDEFQDLTPGYLLLLRLVASPGLAVFGVGDDDQVIYGYAGADPQFLIDFDHLFPGAGHHPLEVNYRCPTPVVEAASNLLSRNRRRVPKKIRPPEGRHDPDDRLLVRKSPFETRSVSKRRPRSPAGWKMTPNQGRWRCCAGSTTGCSRRRRRWPRSVCPMRPPSTPPCCNEPGCAPPSPTYGWRSAPMRWSGPTCWRR